MSSGDRVIKGLAMLEVERLRPSPTNPRDRLSGIDDLAASMREIGLIQPIIVQEIPGGGFQIVAGHRRHAAARKLGLTKVPCVVRRDMLPDEELVAMLVENGQRAGLDPIEEAHAFEAMKAQGHTVVTVARQIGRSEPYVRNRLALLTLTRAEQEGIRAGHYSAAYGNDLVRARRQQARREASPVARPVGRPKGAKTKPYFGDTHPLAAAARARCDHRGAPKVAGTACGPCWEAVIRADESAPTDSGQPGPAPAPAPVTAADPA